MELIKDYLGSIKGLHVYAIVSLLVFVLAFLIIVYHTYRLKKDKINSYKNYPLEDDDTGST